MKEIRLKYFIEIQKCLGWCIEEICICYNLLSSFVFVKKGSMIETL